MDTRRTPENRPSPASDRAKLRPALVVARWALPIAWIAAVVVFQPAIPRMFAAFLLAFLLVNALWQHTSLKRACLMAFALAGLAAMVGELALGTADFVAVPVLWLVDALGALIGTLAAYIAMPVVDRKLNPGR